MTVCVQKAASVQCAGLTQAQLRGEQRVIQCDMSCKMCCDMLQKDSSHDAIKEELIATSKARREDLSFIYVEPTGNDGALEYFGLKAKDTPAFVIHDQSKDAKFVNKNVAAGSLSDWLDEFKVRGLFAVPSQCPCAFYKNHRATCSLGDDKQSDRQLLAAVSAQADRWCYQRGHLSRPDAGCRTAS